MKNSLYKRLGVMVVLVTVMAGFTPVRAENNETTSTIDFTFDHFSICTSSPVCVTKIVQDDRAERLDAYFAKRDMPLAGYGDEFVAAADKYNLDWRLIPAIGVRESSGGKHLMNNNPFGWGSAKIPFKNFSDAIEEVTKNIAGADEDTAKYYKDRTLEKKLWFYNGSVMPAYTGEVIAIMNKF